MRKEKWKDLDGASAIRREEEAPWLTDEEEDEGDEEQHKESETDNALKDHRHPGGFREREKAEYGE